MELFLPCPAWRLSVAARSGFFRMEQMLPTLALCLLCHEISPEEPSGHVATHQSSFLLSLGNLMRSKGQLSPAMPEDSKKADRPQPAPTSPRHADADASGRKGWASPVWGSCPPCRCVSGSPGKRWMSASKMNTELPCDPVFLLLDQ